MDERLCHLRHTADARRSRVNDRHVDCCQRFHVPGVGLISAMDTSSHCSTARATSRIADENNCCVIYWPRRNIPSIMVVKPLNAKYPKP